MPNVNLAQAKNAKFDEFYILWDDVEKEIMAYLDYDPDVFRGRTVLCPCDDPEWQDKSIQMYFLPLPWLLLQSAFVKEDRCFSMILLKISENVLFKSEISRIVLC